MRIKTTHVLLMLGVAIGSLLPTATHARSDLWVTGSTKSTKPLVDIPSLSPLVKARESAVLVIYTETNTPAMMPLPFPFGRQRSAPTPRRTGQGSGFIIHPDGYALTNHHVVEGASRIIVKAGQNPEEIEAEIVGTDANTDIALLKLKGDSKNWPVTPLGDSDRLNIGDFVVAIGNPFGLEMSVSLGIVSARGRNDVAPSGRMGLYDFLQTDASINPGNSGGPLLNLKGEVIGINAAVNTAGQGIGFAIPINMVKRVASDLKDRGPSREILYRCHYRQSHTRLGVQYGVEPSTRCFWYDKFLKGLLQIKPASNRRHHYPFRWEKRSPRQSYLYLQVWPV